MMIENFHKQIPESYEKNNTEGKQEMIIFFPEDMISARDIPEYLNLADQTKRENINQSMASVIMRFIFRM